VDFYENKDKVEKYVEFTPRHDGSELVDKLVERLPAGATVLELGMGPGKDFRLLSKHFRVTASDYSKLFLEMFRERNPDADSLHLDARTIETDRRFDAIFSNKALIHMTDPELQRSFARQREVLNPGGLILHSFWYGDTVERYSGLTFTNRTEQSLAGMLDGLFEIVDIGRHAKMADDDSVYVLAKKPG
jgi:SAM-dependent methyltransferase